MKKQSVSGYLTFLYFIIITTLSFMFSHLWWKKHYVDVMTISERVLYRLTRPGNYVVSDTDIVQDKIQQKKVNESTQVLIKDTFVFDTALYYILWDEIIQKYDLAAEDSLVIDSLVLVEMKRRQGERKHVKSSSEGTVLTDKLIQVVYQFPKRMEQLLYSRTYSDSIFFNITENTLYTIEYWESPLQFKGFRLQDKKVIIYGIQQKVQIYVLPDRSLALAIDTTLYPLVEKSTFTIIK